jgi:hypothetical protein
MCDMSRSWYLFIYQIPPRPLYLRAKIRQLLMKLGAVALKKSAYTLPAETRLLDPLRAIAGETVKGGGEAYICEARFTEQDTEDELLRRFREERAGEYEALISDVARAPRNGDGLKRLRARFDEIRAIDFFNSPSAAKALAALDDLATHRAQPRGRKASPRRANLRNKTWVTRKDVGIDRMASAWLIRRFIDPKARFRFLAPGGRTRPSEVRFDMPDGEFTHRAGRCTFEVLVGAIGLDDSAVTRIGEIVHDIDLRDRKHRRAETAGVAQMIAGIISANSSDEERLERAFTLFDSLYEAFGNGRDR